MWTARQVATALRTVHLVSPARLPSSPLKGEFFFSNNFSKQKSPPLTIFTELPSAPPVQLAGALKMSGVQMRFVWTARQVATALRTVHLVSPARLPSFPFPEPQSAPPALRARALKMAGVRRRFVRTARLVGIALLTARLVSLVSKESGATPSQPQRAPIARQDSTTPTRRRLQFPIALTVVLAATAPRELQQRQLRFA